VRAMNATLQLLYYTASALQCRNTLKQGAPYILKLYIK